MKRRFPHQRPKKSPCPASLKVGTRDKEKGHKENSLSLAAWQAFSSCRQCRGLTFKRFAGAAAALKCVFVQPLPGHPIQPLPQRVRHRPVRLERLPVGLLLLIFIKQI